MPRLLFGEDAAVSAWVAQRIPHLRDPDGFGPCTTLGIVAESEGRPMLAGAVFHNFVPAYQHAELSFAADSPRWATKGIVRAILSVPFEQWRCRRLTMTTPHTNERAISLIKGLGFVREGAVRHYFADGQHALIFGMLRGEYIALSARLGRHIGEDHGQENAIAAACA